MVLGQNPPPSHHSRTKDLTRHGPNAIQTKEVKSYRKGQKVGLAEQTVYSPKERQPGRQADSGPVYPELLHQMPLLQDAYHQGSKDPPSQGFLDSFHRFQRWILASSHSQNQEAISGFPLEEPELAVSRHAIRPQCGSTHLHQGSGPRCENYGGGRYLVPALPGRPPDHCTVPGGVPTYGIFSSGNPQFSGMDPEPEEVPSDPIPEVRMAGSPVRPIFPHSSFPLGEVEIPSGASEGGDLSRTHLPPQSNETPGPGQLERPARPSSQASTPQNQEDYQVLQEFSPGFSHCSQQRSEAQPLQVDYRDPNPSGLRLTKPSLSDPLGRIPGRVGFRGEWHSVRRDVRRVDVISHQCQGTVDNLVFTPHHIQERSRYPAPMRQHFSHSLSQEGLIPQSTPSCPDRIDLETSSVPRVDNFHIIHQGSFNVIADQLSRGTAISTEWSLAPQDFQIILKLNPLLQVDVFATRLNNKLPIFISPCMDSKAQAVDALSTSWERWDHLYMFPPTNMISRALAKLDTTSFKSAVLVTPETPTRPWYMSLCLRETRSVPLEVTLQQTVVGKMVHKAPPSKLRVWLL